MGHDETCFRLEVRVLDALRLEGFVDDVLSFRQRGIDVSAGEPADFEEVARFVHRGRVDLEGCDGVGHGIEHFVSCLDSLGGLAGVEHRIGHDESDHITDTVGDLSLRHEHRPVLHDETDVARSRYVLGGEYTLDTRIRRGPTRIDLEHSSPWVLAENHGTVEHAFDLQVRNVILLSHRMLDATVAGAAPPDPVAGRAAFREQHPAEPEVLSKKMRTARLRPWEDAAVVPGLTRGLNGVEDALIASAAAQMSGEGLGRGISVGGLAVREQRRGPHDDARDTVTALNGTLANKSLGEHPPLLLWNALEGHNLPPFHLRGLSQASQHRVPVHQHRATTTSSLRGTAVLRRRDAAILPQHLQQMHPRLEARGGFSAIQGERDGRHRGTSSNHG